MACREPLRNLIAVAAPTGASVYATTPSASLLNNATTLIVDSVSRMNVFHEESALSHFMRFDLPKINSIFCVVDSRTLEDATESLVEPGDFQLHFVIAQYSVWLIVFLAICLGVRWLGKVLIGNLTITFLILFLMAVRCSFLDGAVQMFDEFFRATTDWERLYDFMVMVEGIGWVGLRYKSLAYFFPFFVLFYSAFFGTDQKEEKEED